MSYSSKRSFSISVFSWCQLDVVARGQEHDIALPTSWFAEGEPPQFLIIVRDLLRFEEVGDTHFVPIVFLIAIE